MEAGLAFGGLSAVVGELVHLPMNVSRRLQLAAEKTGSMDIVLRRWRPQSEASKVEMISQFVQHPKREWRRPPVRRQARTRQVTALRPTCRQTLPWPESGRSEDPDLKPHVSRA
jgi:hypothetical protein